MKIKILPSAKEFMSVKSWQANLPWIVVGAGVAVVGTWVLSNFVFNRNILVVDGANAVNVRSPTYLTPQNALYHPSYALNPTLPVYGATPVYGARPNPGSATPTFRVDPNSTTPTFGCSGCGGTSSIGVASPTNSAIRYY